MRMLSFLFITVLSTAAFSKERQKAPIDTSATRGVFSVGLYVGDTYPRLLNSDGSISSYRGQEYGILLDMSAMVGSGSDFRFFALGGIKNAQGVQASSDSLSGNHFLLGMKAFPLSWFYVSAGIGRFTAQAKTTTASVNLSSPMTALGGGIELNMWDNFYFGVNGWYKSGVLRQNENPELTGNSFTDSFDVLFMFIWCPSSSVTNVFKSKY